MRGRWFRHTYPGSPAIPQRDPPPDNRWQRGNAVDALYLTDSEETVWAAISPSGRFRPWRKCPGNCGLGQLTLPSPTYQPPTALRALASVRQSRTDMSGARTRKSVSDWQAKGGQGSWLRAPPVPPGRSCVFFVPSRRSTERGQRQPNARSMSRHRHRRACIRNRDTNHSSACTFTQPTSARRRRRSGSVSAPANGEFWRRSSASAPTAVIASRMVVRGMARTRPHLSA